MHGDEGVQFFDVALEEKEQAAEVQAVGWPAAISTAAEEKLREGKEKSAVHVARLGSHLGKG